MARTPLFDRVLRDVNLAADAVREGISTEEALARRAAARIDRRSFAKTIGGAAAASLLPSRLIAAPAGAKDVGIVGAGLAGLVCGVELQRAGTTAKLYEAAGRAGGRCFSLPGVFPGQVAERGGELIDNLHKTMIAYAKEFGLTLEDVEKQPGEVFYHLGGKRVPEAQVVAEYRAFVEVMRTDLTKLTGSPSALAFKPFDRELDQISLAAYLDGANGAKKPAGALARAAIVAAYEAEYGRVAAEQSCLNFLLFIHADKRSRFQPFGVFSDERYHVVEGNDRITSGLADKLKGQVQLGQQLVRVKKTAAGRIELTFKSGKTTVTRTHDHVVLTLPFTVLRDVELDANLGLPVEKTRAIRELGYGDNAKVMVGFKSRPWAAQGGNGATYSDLTAHQTTWETSPTRATATNAVITDYSSGPRGARLEPKLLQTEVMRWLADFDKVVPGAAAAVASRPDGTVLAHMEAWPRNPLTKGSYTCYLPGQFTSIAGHEAPSVGSLHFAGEHTNSFYEWQGFMEGACLSGIAAAKQVLK